MFQYRQMLARLRAGDTDRRTSTLCAADFDFFGEKSMTWSRLAGFAVVARFA
jgi:hypothetical protein